MASSSSPTSFISSSAISRVHHPSNNTLPRLSIFSSFRVGGHNHDDHRSVASSSVPSLVFQAHHLTAPLEAPPIAPSEAQPLAPNEGFFLAVSATRIHT